MDFLKQHPWVIPVVVALLLFAVAQMQRRNDKTEKASGKDYLLPEATAEGLKNILDAVKSQLPGKVSSLMLCEFADGRFDIAVGVEGFPIYIYQDHLEKPVVKVVDLSDGQEKSFKMVKNDNEFCGLFVFGEDGVPYRGNLKVENFGSLNVDDVDSAFVLGVGEGQRYTCDLEEDARSVPTENGKPHQITLIPAFKIKFKEKPKTLTSPVFYDGGTHFLGFANILMPAMYRTSTEQIVTKQSTADTPAEYKVIERRELIRASYSVGLPASTIFRPDMLNLDPAAQLNWTVKTC